MEENKPLLDADNPYLQQENYFEGYNESIAKMQQNKENIEFDRLCYAVFSNPNGQRFIDLAKERFIYPSFITPHQKNVGHAALFYEGFKEAFRMIIAALKTHEQRVLAEGANESTKRV